MSEQSDYELVFLSHQGNKAAFGQLVMTKVATRTSAPNNLASEFCCSFCGKRRDQVDILIAGSILETVGIYICNECVDVCNKIIKAEIPPLTQTEVEKLMDSGKLSD